MVKPNNLTFLFTYNLRLNKYYLLTICLFLTFFTGCIEDEENNDATVIEETDDTTKNQDNNSIVKGCINSTLQL